MIIQNRKVIQMNMEMNNLEIPEPVQLIDQFSQLGLEQRNQFLIQSGFVDEKENLKYLLKYKGDQCTKMIKKYHKKQVKALKKLQKKQIKKYGPVPTEEMFKLLEQLKESGYTKEKKNLKLLCKFNGNCGNPDKKLINHIDLVLKKLQKKQMKGIRYSIKQDYASENQQLGFFGFDKVRKNIKALEKANGNLSAAIEWLTKKKQKKEQQDKQRQKQKLDKKEKDYLKAYDEEIEGMMIKLGEEKCKKITHIYLDGNNMFFCDDVMRDLCLSKQRKHAEQVMAEMVAHKIGNFDAKFVYLIFDQTKDTYESETAEGVVKTLFCYHYLKKLVVASARPQFQSSDDALVEISKQLPSLVENTLFVTSDRGLLRRLRENGVVYFMKSKQFIC